MREEKNRKLVIILVAIIIVLLGLIAYMFLLRPALNGYVLKTQTEGFNIAVYQIMQQARQCNQVLTLKNPYGAETMNLIWTDCLLKNQQPPTQ